MDNEELIKLAAEAYVYGYPMVYTIEEQIKHVRGERPGDQEVLGGLGICCQTGNQ